MSECVCGCDGRKNYTDGIFWYCYCKALALNIVCGANVSRGKQ